MAEPRIRSSWARSRTKTPLGRALQKSCAKTGKRQSNPKPRITQSRIEKEGKVLYASFTWRWVRLSHAGPSVILGRAEEEAQLPGGKVILARVKPSRAGSRTMLTCRKSSLIWHYVII